MHDAASIHHPGSQVTNILRQVECAGAGICFPDAHFHRPVKECVKVVAAVAAAGIQSFEPCCLKCGLVITQDFQAGSLIWPAIEDPGNPPFKDSLFFGDFHAIVIPDSRAQWEDELVEFLDLIAVYEGPFVTGHHGVVFASG